MSDEPEQIEKPCSARMKHGGWCLMVDGHIGPHAGAPRRTEHPHPFEKFKPTRST